MLEHGRLDLLLWVLLGVCDFKGSVVADRRMVAMDLDFSIARRLLVCPNHPESK